MQTASPNLCGAAVSGVVVVGAAIIRDGRVLAAQCASGQWELPGGKVEHGESEAAALVRECHEELGIKVIAGPRIGPDAALPGGMVLRIFAASPADAAEEPRALEHQRLRWLGAADLRIVRWRPADEAFLRDLARWLSGRTGG